MAALLLPMPEIKVNYIIQFDDLEWQWHFKVHQPLGHKIFSPNFLKCFEVFTLKWEISTL